MLISPLLWVSLFTVLLKADRMNIGDKVYVAWVCPDRESVSEYTLVEFGDHRLILRCKDEGFGEFALPGRLVSAPSDIVFATRKEAENHLAHIQPQVGDYVAVINYRDMIKGLVVKTTPKMVEILLANEKDIAHNKGKMKSRHYKHSVVTLIRNHQ